MVMLLLSAALAAGPSEAVRERVMSNHTPEHVASVWRVWQWHSMVALERDDAGDDTPDIERDGGAVRAEWEVRFRPALDAMEAYLHDAMPDERWSAFAGSHLSTPEQNIAASRRMLDGVGPSPGVHYVAAFDPRYDADPFAEMNDVVTRVHTTDGSGGSDGLLFRIEAPLSWIRGHVRGGGVAKRLVSEAGAGLASLTVKVVPLEGDEEAPGLDELVTQASDDPVRSSETMLLGQPAMAVVHREETSGRRGASRAVVKRFVCVLERRVVKFDFSVADRARSADDLLPLSELEAEFERLEPLFDEIVRRASATPER